MPLAVPAGFGGEKFRAAPRCCCREPGRGLPAGTEIPWRGEHPPAPCPGPCLTKTMGCASPPGWVPALPRQAAPGRLEQAGLNLITGNKLSLSLFPKNQWAISVSPKASPCPRAAKDKAGWADLAPKLKTHLPTPYVATLSLKAEGITYSHSELPLSHGPG